MKLILFSNVRISKTRKIAQPVKCSCVIGGPPANDLITRLTCGLNHDTTDPVTLIYLRGCDLPLAEFIVFNFRLVGRSNTCNTQFNCQI